MTMTTDTSVCPSATRRAGAPLARLQPPCPHLPKVLQLQDRAVFCVQLHHLQDARQRHAAGECNAHPSTTAAPEHVCISELQLP